MERPGHIGSGKWVCLIYILSPLSVFALCFLHLVVSSGVCHRIKLISALHDSFMMARKISFHQNYMPKIMMFSVSHKKFRACYNKVTVYWWGKTVDWMNTNHVLLKYISWKGSLLVQRLTLNLSFSIQFFSATDCLVLFQRTSRGLVRTFWNFKRSSTRAESPTSPVEIFRRTS